MFIENKIAVITGGSVIAIGKEAGSLSWAPNGKLPLLPAHRRASARPSSKRTAIDTIGRPRPHARSCGSIVRIFETEAARFCFAHLFPRIPAFRDHEVNAVARRRKKE